MKPEDRFVEKLRALLPRDAQTLLGPGDDCAVVSREAGLLAATTDMLVEGVDFLPGEDPERLGRRAAAVNLSDLAAAGALPEYFLLSIGFLPERGDDYPLAIARGALARAGEFGGRLVGGDLSRAPQTVISAAFWGRPAGAPLTRSGARPGDRVFLSGYPGQAAAGLDLAKAEPGAPAPAELPRGARSALLAAYRDPVPRISLGAWLAREGLASSAIDVSDGLGVDAGRIAAASGVRIVIERDRIPISDALRAYSERRRLDPTGLAVGGGDDYELLFTARGAAAARIEAEGGDFGAPVRAVGAVEAGAGAFLRRAGEQSEIGELGHDHFEAAR